MTRGRPLGEVSQSILNRLNVAPVSSTRALAHELQLSIRHAVQTVSNLRAAGYVRDVKIEGRRMIGVA
jgi:DNA-binding IscR family transcriptional regulator